jgi:hypothetical protein
LVAAVTSPAKAGPVKAMAAATANIDINVFIVLLLSVLQGRIDNVALSRRFQGASIETRSKCTTRTALAGNFAGTIALGE